MKCEGCRTCDYDGNKDECWALARIAELEKQIKAQTRKDRTSPCVNVEDCRPRIAEDCKILGWKRCKETKICYIGAKRCSSH